MKQIPRPLLAWLVAAAAVIVALGASLPPDAFFAGDSGVKLIAAENAIRHPTRPFEIDLPRIGGRTSSAYLDPFFVPHGDHAHAVQSLLFPVVSAPLVALFGIRGAYILPAAAFVALVPLVWLVGRQLGVPCSPLVAGAVTVAANPLLFYSLEFWEHAPAAATLAAATAAACARRRSPTATALGSGLLGAVAVMLRPEALWYMAALAVVIWMDGGPRRHLALIGLGFSIGLAPLLSYNWWHFGSLAGLHASANLSALSHGWLGTRLQLVRLWMLPRTIPVLLALIALIAAWVAGARVGAARGPRLLALLAAAVLATSATRRWLDRESLWQAVPVASLALMPLTSQPPGRPRAFVLLGLTLLGVVLTASNDGGAQWGPRYLMIASPVAILLAARGAGEVFRSRRWLECALVAAVLLASAMVSRAAYRELRGAKRHYSAIVRSTVDLTPAGSYVVSDLWWFDQIAASRSTRNTFLFVADAPTGAALIRELEAAGVGSVFVVRSRARSPVGAIAQWVRGTCYSVREEDRLRQREVSLHQLRCER